MCLNLALIHFCKIIIIHKSLTILPFLSLKLFTFVNTATKIESPYINTNSLFIQLKIQVRIIKY